MQNLRKPEVEKALAELGWAGPENKEVQVYCDYRPSKRTNQHLPFEWTVFSSYPLWKWDFVVPSRRNRNGPIEFFDKTYEPGTWQGNLRWDFETDVAGPPELIAHPINRNLEDELDNVKFTDASDPLFHWLLPVQRVEARPFYGMRGTPLTA